MSDTSAIEWTDSTWNPSTGCSVVSPGCAHCYAERLSARLHAMGNPRYRNGFAVTEHEDALELPLRWKKPRRVFVNSMSDLFHEQISDEFISRTFAMMALTPQHTYQVLTKRHERLADYLATMSADPEAYCFAWAHNWETEDGRLVGLRNEQWPLPNVWLGVSVENQVMARARMPRLVETSAAVRFVSVEPMLGPVTLGPWLNDVQWVICGGESGPGHRPIRGEWVQTLRDECVSAGVPFFFKQWGGHTHNTGGRTLDGRQWREFPVANTG